MNLQWSESPAKDDATSFSTRADLANYTLFCRYKRQEGNFEVSIQTGIDVVTRKGRIETLDEAKKIAIKMAVAHYLEVGWQFDQAGIDLSDPQWEF